MTKLCKTCNKEKDVSSFAVEKKNKKEYVRYQCKDCDKEFQAKYRQTHVVSRKEYGITYYASHKSTITKQAAAYYLENKDDVLARIKSYSETNKVAIRNRMRKYERRRGKTEPEYRLAKNVRSLLNQSLKESNLEKCGRSASYTQLSGKELLDYLETKFKPGMTRYNQGTGLDKWHVDHVKPLAAFDTKDPNWIFVAYHYTNLQPLWSEDNIKKSSFYAGTLHKRNK